MLKFSTVLAVAVIALGLIFASLAVEARKPKWHQLQGYTFEQYVRDFNREYAPAEYSVRKSLFEKEMKEVTEHNKDTTKTWKKGINHYSDWTAEEKRKRLFGLDVAKRQRYLAEKGSSRKMHKLRTSSGMLPQTVDYRNAVPAILTAVKDQGQCGSCWAHAAAESVETAYAQVSGQLFVLSQQQVASCAQVAPDDCGGSGGCSGGIVETAVETVSDISGLNQEWSYPYVSYMGQNFPCKFWANLTKVWTSGYVAVQSNNAGAVMDALAFAGPLAISADASLWSNYESGIFAGCDYAKNVSLDHAIQMVGYGQDTLGAYWIVRNSWSTSYGEQGYIRIARFPQGEPCGMAVDPQNGNGCKGQTAPYYTCGMCGVLYETLYATPRYPPNPF